MINPRRYIQIRKSIESILWPRFHKIGDPLSEKNCQYVRNSEIPFPNSYKEFIMEFNFVRLFRKDIDSYRIHLWTTPIECLDFQLGILYAIGIAEMKWIYLRANDFESNRESPVYEQSGTGAFRNTGQIFFSWFHQQYEAVLQTYSPQCLAHLSRLPEPFTSEQREIMAIMKQIRWEYLGVGSNNSRLIRLTNYASTAIGFYRLNIGYPNGKAISKLNLPVIDIKEGASKVIPIRWDSFQNMSNCEQLRITQAPYPTGPEDIPYYCEFGADEWELCR